MQTMRNSYQDTTCLRLLYLVSLFLLFVVSVYSQSTPQPTQVSGTNAVTYDNGTSTYKFTLNSTVLYEYSLLKGGSFNALRARVSPTTTFLPSNFGGVKAILGGQERTPWDVGVTFKLLSNSLLSGDTVLAYWAMIYGVDTCKYKYKLKMAGRTLITIVEADSTSPTSTKASGFDLDRCEEAANPMVLGVPYLTLFNLLLADSVYTSFFFDWEVTNASESYPKNATYSATSKHYAQGVLYHQKTNGIMNRLKEKIYLTFSPNIEDVLPNIPNPVSPYLSASANRIVWDYWESFGKLTKAPYRHLDSLWNNGIRNIWLLIHVWQRMGYDNQLPDITPATLYNDPNFGGQDSLISIINNVKGKGYLVGLHENYFDIDDNSPTYSNDGGSQIIVAKNSGGNPLKNGTRSWGAGYWLIKPSKAAHYIRANYNGDLWSHFGLKDYPTNSSFLDIHSSVDPSKAVDYEATELNAALIRQPLSLYRALGDTLRNIHQGPVSGEGRNHLLYLGYFDDVEAQINSGDTLHFGFRSPLLVDFDLRKLHPKALVHGVGYYQRFYASSDYGQNWNTLSREDVMSYIATELAYGHGSFIPSPGRTYSLIDNSKLEQKHVFPMQKAYVNTTPSQILYNHAGTMLTSSDYIRTYSASYDDTTSNDFMSQVRIEYSNGVVVCVNRHPRLSWTVNVGISGGWFDYHTSTALDTGISSSTTFLLPSRNGWVCYDPSHSLRKSSIHSERNPVEFQLSQNYPNPFNPSTRINYALATSSRVVLKVYDVLGREVAILVNGNQDAGYKSVSFNASSLPSGVYFYRLQAGSFVEVKKMLLMK